MSDLRAGGQVTVDEEIRRERIRDSRPTLEERAEARLRWAFVATDLLDVQGQSAWFIDATRTRELDVGTITPAQRRWIDTYWALEQLGREAGYEDAYNILELLYRHRVPLRKLGQKVPGMSEKRLRLERQRGLRWIGVSLGLEEED